MRTPSWVELAGRNAAAALIHVTGTLVVNETRTDTTSVDFTYAPGGKWRIDHADHPVYLTDGRTTVVRVGDHMQRLDGDIQLPILGRRFSPLDLLGDTSILHKLSTNTRVDGRARRVDTDGREAWLIRMLTPTKPPMLMTFDDETGLIVEITDAEGRALLRVDNLAHPHSLSDSLFVWDGPVAEAGPTRGRRRDADDERERLAFMRALVAAQEESGEVFSAIADSDSEDDARAAVVRLLGVNTMAAEAIMATPIGQFSKDHRASNRRTLETMEHRSEN